MSEYMTGYDRWQGAGNAADYLARDHDRIRKLEAEIKRLRNALSACAEPYRYHAPCTQCGPKAVETGCYLARAALKLDGAA